VVETFPKPRLIPKHLTSSDVLNCESSAKRRRGLPRGWLFAKRRACINHKGGGLLTCI
jgi:hypothetical protein